MMVELVSIFRNKKRLVLIILVFFFILCSISFNAEVSVKEKKENREDISKAVVTTPRHKREHFREPGLLSRLERSNPIQKSRRGDIEWCKSLQWRNTGGPLVALASFPGSGNTWVRYLLQQLTGVHTGSIYNDGDLSRHGFPGEHHQGGDVLVVKTHEWGARVR